MPRFIDLAGQRFGRLSVLSRSENQDKRTMWLCACDCGNKKVIMAHGLRDGRILSCGCLQKEMARKAHTIDLTGERFGRLLTLRKSEPNEYTPKKCRGNHWVCLCTCGIEVIVSARALISGGSRSCGCIRKEKMRALHLKHGGTDTRLYLVWRGMIERCYRDRHTGYKYYGARGICVCDEWRADFGSFRDWAMANGYDETAERNECTIDRIDVNGNYEPSNCRWVGWSVQQKNKRHSRG